MSYVTELSTFTLASAVLLSGLIYLQRAAPHYILPRYFTVSFDQVILNPSHLGICHWKMSDYSSHNHNSQLQLDQGCWREP
jgi:hypothetical protein